MALSPSRRDIIGPPPRDVSDLRNVVRHHGSYLRSLDPGLQDGRWATPRPVSPGQSMLVGSDAGGDGGEDIAFENGDRITASTAGILTLSLTYEPIDGSLHIRWDGEDLDPIEYSLDGQRVTFTDAHIHVGDVLSAAYAYYPTDAVTPDPGGWYRFNEPSGALMADSSGNGHDGTYTAVTLGQPSLMLSDTDPAASWNGSTSHALVAYGSWMDAPAISGVIMCKGSGAGGGQGTLMAREQTSGGRLWNLRVGSSFGGGGGLLSFVFGGISFQPVISTSFNVADGVRHMVGFSYDGATLKLYADGVLRLAQAVAATYIGSAGLSFGSCPSGGGDSYLDIYTGVLDEARYYPGTEVLTDDDFANLWAAS